MGAKLEGKRVMYIIKQTLYEYVTVATPNLKAIEQSKELEEITKVIRLFLLYIPKSLRVP